VTVHEDLEDAIIAFNRTQIAELALETGLLFRGLDNGRVHLLGAVRVLAMFQGADGRWWGDAALAIESMDPDDEHMTEYWHQQIAGCADECHDLWVYSDVRGKWNALIVPLAEMARRLELDAPLEMPPGEWARTWWDLPTRTDSQELGWIAHGGKPLHTYRGSQL
jgi:hypothetical protein